MLWKAEMENLGFVAVAWRQPEVRSSACRNAAPEVSRSARPFGPVVLGGGTVEWPWVGSGAGGAGVNRTGMAAGSLNAKGEEGRASRQSRNASLMAARASWAKG